MQAQRTKQPLPPASKVRIFYNIKAIAIAKQKHPRCKKVQGQSEAALQIGMCDQKL